MDSIEARDTSSQKPKTEKETGKVGMAILLWMLGVPGSIILLYLIFGH